MGAYWSCRVMAVGSCRGGREKSMASPEGGEIGGKSGGTVRTQQASGPPWPRPRSEVLPCTRPGAKSLALTGDAKGWTEDRYREVPQKAVSQSAGGKRRRVSSRTSRAFRSFSRRA